ncbi:hypothetical protein OF83DRAFT_1171678 [Amylostereum chailletii]|nr:hypothetical protein OF83DRAFT_1171678 [Amylostereum chailletii]
MPDPSTILADAFKTISQATVTALRAYEQGERARLAEAGDEIRQLRRERDDAIAQVQSVKQQDAAWAVEVDKWKAELDKADLAVCVAPSSTP